jgi:hypothetical protein
LISTAIAGPIPEVTVAVPDPETVVLAESFPCTFNGAAEAGADDKPRSNTARTVDVVMSLVTTFLEAMEATRLASSLYKATHLLSIGVARV